MTMKRILGPALFAVLLLTGCADSNSDAASDPSGPASTSTGASSATAEPSSTGGLEPQTVAIVSQTAGGGSVDLHAVPVDDEASLQAFTQQFERGGLNEKIAQAVAGATVPDGYTVMAAVVAIGCDVPPGVTAEQGPDGWVFTPEKVAEPMQECFAPVTSVALVAVPA
jgi:hypothetical protein